MIVAFFIINGSGVYGTNLQIKTDTIIESVSDNNLVFTLMFPSSDELRFSTKDGYQRIEVDNYHSATAQTLDEAKKLVEAGFEYVTDMEGVKLFRKPKC